MLRLLLGAVVVTAVLGVSGCSKDNSPIQPPAETVNVKGYWEGYTLDSNDQSTEYAFYLHVRDSVGKLVGEGIFVSIEDTLAFELPLSLTRKGDSLNISFATPDSSVKVRLQGRALDSANFKALVFHYDAGDNDTGSVLFLPFQPAEELDINSPFGKMPVNEMGEPRLTLQSTPVEVQNSELQYKWGTGSIPLIFIHGMNSNAATWDDFLGRMRSSSLRSKYRVYTYQYDWKKRVQENASSLRSLVEQQGLAFENLLLVGHSMGGMVARSYARQYPNVQNIVTIGSPHTGSPFANLSSILTFLIAPGVNDCAVNSPFLQDLNNIGHGDAAKRANYVVLASEMVKEWKRFGFISYLDFKYNYDWRMKLTNALIYNANDGLIPYASARMEGVNSAPVAFRTEGDHLQIIKGIEPTTSVYGKLLQVLE